MRTIHWQTAVHCQSATLALIKSLWLDLRVLVWMHQYDSAITVLSQLLQATTQLNSAAVGLSKQLYKHNVLYI